MSTAADRLDVKEKRLDELREARWKQQGAVTLLAYVSTLMLTMTLPCVFWLFSQALAQGIAAAQHTVQIAHLKEQLEDKTQAIKAVENRLDKWIDKQVRQMSATFVTGKVIEVKADKMTVAVDDKAGTVTKTFTFDPDLQVFVDGKNVPYRSAVIPVGALVRFMTAGDHDDRVVMLEVLPPKKD